MIVEELAKKKVELRELLEAYNMCNSWGTSLEDRISLETRILRTRRELATVERDIEAYVHSKESK